MSQLPARDTLLLVDDDEVSASGSPSRLCAAGSKCTARPVTPKRDYLGLAKSGGAIVDLRVPRPGGLVTLATILAAAPRARVIVLTAYGSIATAVEAMRRGAFDYLTKPCHADDVVAALRHQRAELGVEAEQGPSLARHEHEYIEQVLVDCGGNISRAARRLGIHRRTLQYKLAKYPVSR